MRFLITFCLFSIITGLPAQQYDSRYNTGETGIAVYYADYLHGRITAMGEVYRQEAYTAAHKTYPKGTLLRVTRLDNGLSTVVRVNDRGPFTEGVMIDLSKAAAMDIGLLKDGRAQVRIEQVGRSGQNPRGGQLPRQTTDQYASTAYNDSATDNRSTSPGYSSSSYEPRYPAAAARNNYTTNRRNPAGNQSSKGDYRQGKGYNPPPPADQVYREQAYSSSVQAAKTYPESYPSTNENLTAKGGYSGDQPASYGQVGGALASRAPGAAQSSSTGRTTTIKANELPRGTQGFAVQIGSYRNDENATRQVEELQSKGLNNVYIMESNGLHKVVIAPFQQKTDAQNYLDDLRRSFLIDGLVTMIR